MRHPITESAPDSLPWDRFNDPLLLNASLSSSHPVCVIGAGLAGCWMARLLAECGVTVRVLESERQPGKAASGNPAGITKPFVTRAPGFAMEFYVAAHRFLLQQLAHLDLARNCQYTPCGVLQLVLRPFQASAHFSNYSAAQTSELAGVTINANSIGFDSAGWLNPAKLCEALLCHPLIELKPDTSVTEIKACTCNKASTRWQVVSRERSFGATHVIIASGVSLTRFDQSRHLPITPARGQISRFSVGSTGLRCVISGKHYAIPDGDSVLVGATFARGNTDSHVRECDHSNNLNGLKTLLPDLMVDDKPLAGYAGVRATTPDRLPLIGPVPDHDNCEECYRDLRHGKSLSRYPDLPVHEGLYLIGGLGSRGITTAPLAAALLVEHLTTTPQARDSLGSLTHFAPLINPARFHIRSLKRGLT